MLLLTYIRVILLVKPIQGWIIRVGCWLLVRCVSKSYAASGRNNTGGGGSLGPSFIRPWGLLFPFMERKKKVSWKGNFLSFCSHTRVFGKTLVHEFHISYCYTEWYLLVSDSPTTGGQCVFGAKKSKYLRTSKPIAQY